MKKTQDMFRVLKENRLIALLAPKTVDSCINAYEALSPLGIVLEIALRTDMALEGIRAVVEKHPDALVLAGTVMTASQVGKAVRAGAAGIVSADYISAVVACSVRHDLMCVPGGHGDVGKQLAQKAELYGCGFEELREKHPHQWIHKLFPAVTSDAMYMGLSEAWKGPFPGLRMVYTGGVTLQNLGGLVKRDPDGIFCGSAMTRAVEDPKVMVQEAREWIGIIKSRLKL